MEHVNYEIFIPVEGLTRRKTSEVRASEKVWAGKKKFGSHWYGDSSESPESRWGHPRGGQTESEMVPLAY